MDQDIHRWERLEELFAQAVELPHESQAALIERETASDPELGARISALLHHDRIAGARISRVIAGAAQMAADPVDWTGRYFGPYRVVREIGRGGMGLVFEAVRDDDEYRKTVAVKVVPWWCDVALLRDRFRHERQILAGLEHPNIARFLDGGTQSGVPYFAMEYVAGCPITEYCSRLKLRGKIELFRQVCAAVHYAHQSLLVHRDLKPGNILVNDEGVPKLLDFGIAKLLSPLEGASQNTMTGAAPWTPDYASPEQVRGGPITTRTDVYSLGLFLFELLTGERGQTADKSSPLALDRSICEAEAPRPSTRAPQAVRRHVAGDLDTIVGKATHKDPERRYNSVAQFSDDLERYLDGRPVLARPDSLAYRASKFLRRNWLPVTAAGVTLLSLVAGAASFAWEARLAESRFNQVRKLATGFLFEVHDKVQNLPGSTEVRGMLTRTAVDTLGTLARDAGRNYPLRRELAAAYLRLGEVQGAPVGASRGRNAEALASLEQGLSLLNGLPASELAAAAATEAGLREQRGRILSSVNRPAEAEGDLKRALEIRRSLCRDPQQEKDACANRLNAAMALAEWNLRHRQADGAEQLIGEMDQSLAALQPVMSPLAYEKQSLRGRIMRARLQWIRDGERQAAGTLLPVLPEVEKLVASHSGDQEAVRLGSNYCEQLGSMLLGMESRPADPQLGRILRDGVEWSERLVRFDADDQRPRRQAAGALGMLGDFLVREDPVRGAAVLGQALDGLLEQMRLSPANTDVLAQVVDHGDRLVRVLVDQGREQEAANAARKILEFYDPLMWVSMKIARTPAVHEIQALAWVAQSGYAAGKAKGAWYRDSARRADTVLAGNPPDPALRAAAAMLYESLPGSPPEQSPWRRQAAELWSSLAAQFPDNTALRERAAKAAGPPPLPSHSAPGQASATPAGAPGR